MLHIDGLDVADMGELVDGLVLGLPEPARAALVSRAEGIPLFAVETVRGLIDQDLVIPRGGRYVLGRIPSSISMPSLRQRRCRH